MWNHEMSLSTWVAMGLLIPCLTGCGAKYDLYGQQVKRADDLSVQGQQSLSQGNLTKASKDFSRALDTSRSIDYSCGVAQQLNNLGAVALEQGDLAKAKRLFTQAWEINQDRQHWSDGSVNQANLATVAQKAGGWGEAAEHLQLAQDAAQRSRDKTAQGRVLIRWASFYLDQQNPASAAASLEQARKLANTSSLRGALAYQRGRLFMTQGNTSEAMPSFCQALFFDRKILDRAAMAADLFSLGEAHQLRGEMSQAWEYFSRAFDVYASMGKKAQSSRCLARLASGLVTLLVAKRAGTGIAQVLERVGGAMAVSPFNLHSCAGGYIHVHRLGINIERHSFSIAWRRPSLPNLLRLL
jgi:tetratricopeptide (TPR) repeat protein